MIECVCVLVTWSCPTLCDPMYSSPPGSSVHGISQARILEWVASSFLRGSSQPRDQTQVSHIDGGFFTIRGPREGTFMCIHHTSLFLLQGNLGSPLILPTLLLHFKSLNFVLIWFSWSSQTTPNPLKRDYRE